MFMSALMGRRELIALSFLCELSLRHRILKSGLAFFKKLLKKLDHQRAPKFGAAANVGNRGKLKQWQNILYRFRVPKFSQQGCLHLLGAKRSCRNPTVREPSEFDSLFRIQFDPKTACDRADIHFSATRYLVKLTPAFALRRTGRSLS